MATDDKIFCQPHNFIGSRTLATIVWRRKIAMSVHMQVGCVDFDPIQNSVSQSHWPRHGKKPSFWPLQIGHLDGKWDPLIILVPYKTLYNSWTKSILSDDKESSYPTRRLFLLCFFFGPSGINRKIYNKQKHINGADFIIMKLDLVMGPKRLISCHACSALLGWRIPPIPFLTFHQCKRLRDMWEI